MKKLLRLRDSPGLHVAVICSDCNGFNGRNFGKRSERHWLQKIMCPGIAVRTRSQTGGRLQL